MSEPSIVVATTPVAESAPLKPAGASVVAPLTILVSSFNILTEAIYDCLEWIDVVPYRGLGFTILGGALLFASIFTAKTRGRVALIVSVGIAAYYITQVIAPALR